MKANGKQVMRTGRWGSRAAFTLVELLVVIAIISVLAAMLMPALKKALESSRKTVCVNQLHQWTLSMQAYASDYAGYYPGIKIGAASPYTWYQHSDYATYIGIPNLQQRMRLFSCPSWHGAKDSYGNAVSYMLWYPESAGTDYSPRANSSTYPSKLALLVDARAQGANLFYTWLSGGNGAFTWKISWINTLRGLIRDTSTATGSYGDGYRHPPEDAGAAFWDLHVGGLSDMEIQSDYRHSAPARAQ